MISARRLVFRWRRAWFVVRAHALARTSGATIEIDLAPDARIGRHILLYVHPGTRNALRVGSRSFISDDAVLHFQGGSIAIGERTEVRRGFKADTSGALRIGDDCIISYGIYVHCAEATTIHDMAAVGEYVTITDSTHLRTHLDVPAWQHIRTAPTVIGRNCWIGAHAVIAAGVEVGDGAVVGANSTVTEDVPPGWLAVGSPARAVRRLEVVDVDGPS